MEIVAMKVNSISSVALALISVFAFTPSVHAQMCTMSGYKASPGMSATAAGDGLTIT